MSHLLNVICSFWRRGELGKLIWFSPDQGDAANLTYDYLTGTVHENHRLKPLSGTFAKINLLILTHLNKSFIANCV